MAKKKAANLLPKLTETEQDLLARMRALLVEWKSSQCSA
jgi:hypothetical protein